MGEGRVRVLFLCTGNSARSQIAESLLRHLSQDAIEVASAGTDPKPEIHPMARRAIQTQFGLNMAGQSPKSLDPFLKQHFDYVITVCDNAAETCPMFPGAAERIHWSLPDPAAATGTDEQRQRTFDNTARDLLSRLRLWLSLPTVHGRLGAAKTEGAQ
jgi:protein-tyrosine-phosphatase